MSARNRATRRTEGTDAAVETVEWTALPVEDGLDRVVEAAADAALVFDAADDVSALEPERGHRAIGVVYDPERELGNYVPTVLPERYDSFLHLEETGALHPLATDEPLREAPETYPWGV